MCHPARPQVRTLNITAISEIRTWISFGSVGQVKEIEREWRKIENPKQQSATDRFTIDSTARVLRLIHCRLLLSGVSSRQVYPRLDKTAPCVKFVSASPSPLVWGAHSVVNYD